MAVVERKVPAEPQEKEESIFSYYSVENEVEFLKRMAHLPDEEQLMYLRENLIGFLGEFAGKISYKRLPYLVKDGTFTFAGIPVVDTYWQSAFMNGSTSREWHETVGMDHVEKVFKNNNIQSATIFSPPKTSDYAFIFHYENGGYDKKLGAQRIDEYIIRYPEERETLSNTNKIRSLIFGEQERRAGWTAENYLETPFIYQGESDGLVLDAIVQAASISQADIVYSRTYEERLRSELAGWIDQYSKGIHRLAFEPINAVDRPLCVADEKRILTALFNKAQSMEREMFSGERPQFYKHDPLLGYFDDYYRAQEFSYYASQRAVIVGGGTCPITQRPELFSLDTIAKGLNAGMTIGSQLESKHTSWEYHRGDCVHCKLRNVEVGPCNICKKCEKIL